MVTDTSNLVLVLVTGILCFIGTELGYKVTKDISGIRVGIALGFIISLAFYFSQIGG